MVKKSISQPEKNFFLNLAYRLKMLKLHQEKRMGSHKNAISIRLWLDRQRFKDLAMSSYPGGSTSYLYDCRNVFRVDRYTFGLRCHTWRVSRHTLKMVQGAGKVKQRLNL
jgi:hypothetical protein